MAFLPLGQGSFVWEKPFAIQSHKTFSHTKNLRERHPKIFRACKIRSPQATNWQKLFRGWARNPAPEKVLRATWFSDRWAGRWAAPQHYLQDHVMRLPGGRLRQRNPPTGKKATHCPNGLTYWTNLQPRVPPSDSHSELESVPTKFASHQLAEILRPSVSLRVSRPLQAPGAAGLLMGVWNTQIEPRSG